jgi:hypothetical protein
MLFAIEASIMSARWSSRFGIPIWIGYIISAVMVIPLVTHGVRWISRFQLLTQPFWIVLNILPFGLHRCGRNSTSGAPFRHRTGLATGFGHRALRPRRVRRRLRRHPRADAADRRAGRLLRFLPPEGLEGRRHRIAVFLAGPAGSSSARRSCWRARSSSC